MTMPEPGPLVTGTEQGAAPIGRNGGLPIDPPARKRGRPSSSTPEVVDRIFARLAEAESLRSICRDPGMPSVRTILGWVATRPEFRRQYDLARTLGVHTIGDEVLDIVDGLWRRNSPDALGDARREIDAKKWHLGRMAPKRRGPQPVTVNP